MLFIMAITCRFTQLTDNDHVPSAIDFSTLLYRDTCLNIALNVLIFRKLETQLK